MGGTLDDIVAGFVVVVAVATAQLVGPLSVVAVTRSQRGHMDRADAGSGGSQLWAEITAAGPTFMALSSSTSFCSRRFCSVRDPYHLFKYSHSISVCFSLLLQYLIFHKYLNLPRKITVNDLWLLTGFKTTHNTVISKPNYGQNSVCMLLSIPMLGSFLIVRCAHSFM